MSGTIALAPAPPTSPNSATDQNRFPFTCSRSIPFGTFIVFVRPNCEQNACCQMFFFEARGLSRSSIRVCNTPRGDDALKFRTVYEIMYVISSYLTWEQRDDIIII